MSTDKRIHWADSMKGLSAIMVMLYHASVHPEVKVMAYLLCLPAFFFVAGLFAHPERTPGCFFRRSTMRLLIPYILFGILSWCLWLAIRQVNSACEEEIYWWIPLWGIVCGKVEYLIQNRPLWFLCCMICTEWLYYLLSRVPHKAVRWIGACIIAGLGCLLSRFGKTGIWEITAAMLVLPLYMVGAEGRSFFLERVTNWKYTRLSLLLVCALIGIGIGYYFNPIFHISTCMVGNPTLFYITAFSVIGFWLALCAMIDKGIGKMQWLSYFGQNTLIVLCTHIPVYSMIKGVALLMHVPSSFFTTNIGSMVLWICSILLMFPIMYCINRYLPFLIGKRTTP